MKIQSIVLYNGNHYFSGDVVFGECINEFCKIFIIDEYTDKYGNLFKNKVEVDPNKCTINGSPIKFSFQKTESNLP